MALAVPEADPVDVKSKSLAIATQVLESSPPLNRTTERGVEALVLFMTQPEDLPAYR
jgi:hypothetical protein